MCNEFEQEKVIKQTGVEQMENEEPKVEGNGRREKGDGRWETGRETGVGRRETGDGRRQPQAPTKGGDLSEAKKVNGL